ncbi:hypothetical protein JG688_00016811 [Phytophthora aleatoria]|uniref:DUF659 domain-containing protein n=1 Tax=Phytophthora aleatoria TaxID=2496075 RepID=A0A8J5IBM4_9STRA|nr:hypothetical protein JG688_00016811 [Phytophthora aleatoria]
MPSPTTEVSKAEEESFNVEIATDFFTVGISFRVIDNPHMRRALTRYRPHMKLPTRHALATSLLDTVYTMEKDKLARLLRRQASGVFGYYNRGWSNINREGIVNYVIWSPGMRRPMMWSSGTIGSAAHTGDFMASEISRIIAEVEAVAGKVSAVVSDNAANMKKSRRLIESKHPAMVFNGCSAHAMNLLLKDVFKLELFAEILKKAVKVVTFVRASC